MKTPFLLLAGILAPLTHAAVVTTSGIYDGPATTANDVDATAPGSTDLATFKLAIAAAYANNTGGVITFDNLSGSFLDTSMSTLFGVSEVNQMTITRTTGQGSYFFELNTAVGSPISGGMYLRNQGTTGGASVAHTFNFSVPLSQIAFTAISRNAARTVTATVTYAEGGTAVLTDSLTGTALADDTFFGFIAPEGKTITSMVIDAGTGNFFAIDDLAFIAIPEPSAGALAISGLAGLLLRRRRTIR